MSGPEKGHRWGYRVGQVGVESDGRVPGTKKEGTWETIEGGRTPHSWNLSGKDRWGRSGPPYPLVDHEVGQRREGGRILRSHERY